jgi:hypothetical protein
MLSFDNNEQGFEFMDFNPIYWFKKQADLAVIAVTSNDSRKRKAAVEKVADEGVLRYIAQNDSVRSVRLEAMKKINTREVWHCPDLVESSLILP